MKEFLKGQSDYIYFFYGFSFFLLALISLTLSRERLQKFPWVLLGMFGLFHCFHEWLEMLIVIFGENSIIIIAEHCALIISYLYLFEFARIGLLEVKGKRISRWVYLPIFILVFLGYRYVSSGWVTIVRYFLGFPSVYFASRIIYEFARTEKTNRGALIFLSMSLAVYAVLTGIVVPKAAFIPASVINIDSFYNTFGIPAELARGTAALFAALAIWFYSSKPSEKEFVVRYSMRFMPSKWMVSLTLVVFIATGWLFTNHLDYYAGMQVIERNKFKTAAQLNMLANELSRLAKAAISLSKARPTRTAVSSSGPLLNEKEVNRILDKFKSRLQVLSCSLMDRQGNAIAVAGDGGSGIEIGKSYISAPYFKKALSGYNGYYFKLGPEYNERIYFVSYPVKDFGGKVSGAVVIAEKIHAEPLFQYRLFSIMITFFVCVIAIIFFLALRRREIAITFIEKAHERLKEADRMKTDFISAVSHELRTPLTSIKNAAGILIKGGPAKRTLDEQEKELLEIILDNAERQDKMVNDLLDVSKIEVGVMPISPKAMDIGDTIRHTVVSFKLPAEKKKINIDLDIEAPYKSVYADPELVRRILNNLLSNAIKFTPTNGRITIKARDIGKEIKVTVSDTGIGISEVEKENLFKKFCRTSQTMGQRQGCGLGLAITKGLVEAQKGRIWVDSQLGKGSSFYFTLPKYGQMTDEKS